MNQNITLSEKYICVGNENKIERYWDRIWLNVYLHVIDIYVQYYERVLGFECLEELYEQISDYLSSLNLGDYSIEIHSDIYDFMNELSICYLNNNDYVVRENNVQFTIECDVISKTVEKFFEENILPFLELRDSEILIGVNEDYLKNRRDVIKQELSKHGFIVISQEKNNEIKSIVVRYDNEIVVDSDFDGNDSLNFEFEIRNDIKDSINLEFDIYSEDGDKQTLQFSICFPFFESEDIVEVNIFKDLNKGIIALDKSNNIKYVSRVVE